VNDRIIAPGALWRWSESAKPGIVGTQSKAHAVHHDQEQLRQRIRFR
jgi:hypothetical protein